jgi:hypothetical protein
VYLFTRSAVTAVSEPAAKTSDPSWLWATVRRASRGDRSYRSFVSRFVVDIRVNAPPGSSRLDGVVDLSFPNRPPISIPVSYEVRQPYRLSATKLEVVGLPGQFVQREVYYEVYDPEWAALEVVSAPQSVRAKVDLFDSTTKVLRLEVVMPSSLDGRGADEESIVLNLGKSGCRIRLPIHYELARRTED